MVPMTTSVPTTSVPTTALRPRLTVSDAAAAIAFYTAALGATELIRFTDDAGATIHAELTIDGAGFYIKDADRRDHDPISLGGTPVLLSLRVPTTAAVDATVDAAVVGTRRLNSTGVPPRLIGSWSRL